MGIEADLEECSTITTEKQHEDLGNRLLGPYGFALILLGSASGGKIIWRSLARPHVTSEGMPLTSEMVFQLGVFSEEFVPTRFNVAQWASHWYVAAETTFDEAEERFSDTFAVVGHAAPFWPGTQGYVRGKQGQEWLLITGDSGVGRQMTRSCSQSRGPRYRRTRFLRESFRLLMETFT